MHRYGLDPLRSTPRSLVAVAWAHFQRATWRDSPAVRAALAAMEQARKIASGHGTSADALLYVVENEARFLKAVRALP